MKWSRLGLLALLVVPALALGTQVPAAASPAACGYRVGPIFPNRGAGNGGFDVSLLPAAAGQRCTVTVAASGVITLPGGGRPTNVANNPSAGAVTVSFSPFVVVPRISWQWRPFCADPSTVLFTATVGASSSTVTVGANSCQSFGGSSALLAPAPSPVPVQPALTGVAGTPTGAGLWAAEAGGTVKSAGDATALGGPAVVAAPIVGLARTPSGHGYWLVGSDGGIFTFGDARFFGSTGALRLNEPVVGMAATPDGGGYWLVAADGGIFTFGTATYEGSAAGTGTSAPVTGMTVTPSGKGYALLVEDGNVVSFGDAPALVLH